MLHTANCTISCAISDVIYCLRHPLLELLYPIRLEGLPKRVGGVKFTQLFLSTVVLLRIDLNCEQSLVHLGLSVFFWEVHDKTPLFSDRNLIIRP